MCFSFGKQHLSPLRYYNTQSFAVKEKRFLVVSLTENVPDKKVVLSQIATECVWLMVVRETNSSQRYITKNTVSYNHLLEK